MWAFVAGLLWDPERLREGLEEMIEQEHQALRGDPDRQAKAWLDKLAGVDRKRACFHDMAAEAVISFEELRAKLIELYETRKTAEKELEALRGRRETINQLEPDRDALLEHHTKIVSEALNDLTGEAPSLPDAPAGRLCEFRREPRHPRGGGGRSLQFRANTPFVAALEGTLAVNV